MALVKLMSAGSHPEAQLIKGLLGTEGIPCVINCESGYTEMGTEAGFAEILILVNEQHLERGRLLVEAEVVAQSPAQPGVPAEGALCPVHELVATGSCARCGSHLCARCGKVGEPLLCEACDGRPAQAPRSRSGTRLVALLMLAVFFGLPLLGLALTQLLFGGR